MPVSAYLKSGLFVVAAAAALFAAAGTIAIASFWTYLAILAVVMIVSFAAQGLSAIRSSKMFCYTAISSSGIVGILPGYLIREY